MWGIVSVIFIIQPRVLHVRLLFGRRLVGHGNSYMNFVNINHQVSVTGVWLMVC